MSEFEPFSSEESKVENYFNSIWQRESVFLKENKIKPAKMFNGTTVPVDYCISTVGRVVEQTNGQELTNYLLRALGNFEQILDTQFIYPKDSLHISLIGCTQRYPSIESLTEERLAKIDLVCSNVLSNRDSTKILFKGLNIIGNQIFIQGFPYNRNWEDSRLNVVNALLRENEEPISYPDKFPIHLNIVRITDVTTEDLLGIQNLLEANRDTVFGAIDFDTIELVITDFVLSKDNFTSYKKYKLGHDIK